MLAVEEEMVRLANRNDIPILVGMMRQYAEEVPIAALKGANTHDANHVTKMLFEILVGKGFIYIDKEIRGFIAAIKTPNVWCPGIVELRELAWWVIPEYRKKTIGGKLWLAFDRKAQDMLDDGEIDFVCTTVMSTSMIDYTKRGYKPLEATFYRD
jgi:hypothetical protein